MRTNSCPCCGGSLLRHIRHNGVYWFCRFCWQEVPTVEASQSRNSVSRNSLSRSSENLVIYSHIKKAPLLPSTWLRKAPLADSQCLSNYMS
ncbi:MAG: hypothetical protein AAF208_13715 [Cyanobacteria bacterium P01_A01_bin.45]